jgi:hypothetical protein
MSQEQMKKELLAIARRPDNTVCAVRTNKQQQRPQSGGS